MADIHFTESNQSYDRARTEILSGYGLKVIRFTNDDVLSNFQNVCKSIDTYFGQILGKSPLRRGIERDGD